MREALTLRKEELRCGKQLAEAKSNEAANIRKRNREKETEKKKPRKRRKGSRSQKKEEQQQNIGTPINEGWRFLSGSLRIRTGAAIGGKELANGEGW